KNRWLTVRTSARSRPAVDSRSASPNPVMLRIIVSPSSPQRYANRTGSSTEQAAGPRPGAAPRSVEERPFHAINDAGPGNEATGGVGEALSRDVLVAQVCLHRHDPDDQPAVQQGAAGRDVQVGQSRAHASRHEEGVAVARLDADQDLEVSGLQRNPVRLERGTPALRRRVD